MALEAAKSDFDQGKAAKGKERNDGLAPGLHSPASMANVSLLRAAS